MTVRGLASGKRGPSFSRAPVEVVEKVRPMRWLERRTAYVATVPMMVSNRDRGALDDIGENFTSEYFALRESWMPPRELLDDALLDFEGNMFRCSTLRRSMTWLAWLCLRYGSE